MAEKSLNKTQIIGRLGGDPELRYTANGQPVATLNVATSDSWTDAQGQAQERTEWHRVVLWGKLGEIAGDYLKKGSRVYLEGRLQTNKWTDKTGNERETKELIARDMILLGGKGDSHADAPQPAAPAPAMTGKPQPAAKPMPTEREMDAAMTAGDIPF